MNYYILITHQKSVILVSREKTLGELPMAILNLGIVTPIKGSAVPYLFNGSKGWGFDRNLLVNHLYEP